jgi:DNA-binding NarL/FixJ family response regulator
VTIRVLVVDDHPVVRAGLQALLRAETDIAVVGEAADGREAVALVEANDVDVVLTDLQMPEMDGVAATAALRARPDPPAVLVLTTYDTDADITRAIEAGATGYLLKDAPPDELLWAVRAAAAGQAVFAPAVAARVLDQIRTPARPSLSGREIEILGHVAAGSSNKQIAAALYLSEATVKTHLVHIYDKLGVDSRTAAVAAAVDKGILRMR